MALYSVIVTVITVSDFFCDLKATSSNISFRFPFIEENLTLSVRWYYVKVKAGRKLMRHSSMAGMDKQIPSDLKCQSRDSSCNLHLSD